MARDREAWRAAFHGVTMWRRSLSRVWLFVTPWTIVHGILQARILEWVAVPFSRGSSQPRDRTQVSCIADRFFNQVSHKGSPRILEWVAYPFSSKSFQPRNQTGISCIAGIFFTNWAIRKAQLDTNMFMLSSLGGRITDHSFIVAWLFSP